MKFLTLFIFLTFTLFSAKLQIEGDNFERNQKSGVSSFSGNVKIKQGLDELNATKVLVYVDENNRPVKYEASGNVSFSVTSENNATYKGKSQKLVFLPNIKEYQFYKQVFIQEKGTARTLSGEKIILSMVSGNAKIAGKAKVPVRVTFEIDDENTTKKGLNSKPADKNTTASKNQKVDTNSTAVKAK